MIICPRCATANSRWERRCTACWLPLPATAESDVATPPAAAVSLTHAPVQSLLGLEATHVEALLSADISTVEHLAQAEPERIAAVLRKWTHIDPAALVAKAQQLVHRNPTTTTR